MEPSHYTFILLASHFIQGLSVPAIDHIGYVVYCPCMGRFGNQADHFLGSLSFAHGLNRTLILPPWNEFPVGGGYGSKQVAFDRYFDVGALQDYHRVMTMEDFMRQLAPEVWPPGHRTVFCYSERHGPIKGTCNAKDGNPFGPFWDHFKIDFDKSEFYGHLSFDTHETSVETEWNMRYPASQYPVLAFIGAPSSFPVKAGNIYLQKYLKWSRHIASIADKFIAENIGEGNVYVGVHLRNGEDWKNACEHVQHSPSMFASAQCMGYNGEYGKLTQQICFPRQEDVVKDVKKWIKKVKAKVLFIATDDNPMIQIFQKALKSLKIKLVQQKTGSPHVDLAVLGRADHFIGNCVSTFSAFVKRERDSNKKTSSFFNFESKEGKRPKEEL